MSAALDPIVHAGLGLLLGLSLAGPPGPVNALIARESSRNGVLAGIRAGMPAPIVDTAYMLLVLLGLPRLIDLAAIAPWLAGAGAVLMVYLALQIARIHGAPRALSGPFAVWAVTLTNPFQYAWWVAAGTSALAPLGLPGVLGFMAAIFGWVFVFSFLVSKGAQRWDWFTPLLEVVSADLLLVFGLQMAVTAAGL